MSLQVHDPRLRSRSKSPSGRSTRERSRSRDSRAPSPAPEAVRKDTRKYYDYDSADETPRYVSGQQKVKGNEISGSSTYRGSSQKDRSDSDREKSRYTERQKDRYYHSDSDDGSRYRGNGRSGRSRHNSESEGEGKNYYLSHGNKPSSRPSSRYDSYDDASLTDSDDEALAYGELPATIAGKQYKSSSRRPSDASDKVPGAHPSYARPDRWSYAQPSQVSHTQPAANFHEKRHSSYSSSQAPTLPADWAPVPECERPGFVPPVSNVHTQSIPGAFPTLSNPTVHVQQERGFFTSHAQSPPVSPRPQYATLPHQQYVQQPLTQAPSTPSTLHPAEAQQLRYANPSQWQYAHPDPNIKYGSKTNKVVYTQGNTNQFVKPYTQSAEPQFVEIKPSAGRPDTSSQRHRPHSLSVSSANNLSVTGVPVGRPPASPLLEAYKGTYQSISPMPSPIMMAPRLDDDLSDLELLDAPTDSERRIKHKRQSSRDDREHKEKRREKEREKEKEKEREKDRKDRKSRHERHSSATENVVLISPTSARKKVSFYDPTEHALALRDALSHHRSVDTKPLLDILPHLTSDEILLLRAEYKNHAKLHGKGINIAKHIKLKLGNSSFGKVCYATALGRWESEAHWANYYYQAGTSRRELLIESLIGRTNSEIREIKSCFRDTRYGNSLEKCMHAELKADKFRTAILLALEERRQSDREPLDRNLIHRDVQELHRAVTSREGGETAMLNIIVLRSDTHLREVLRAYEALYQQNFARALIAKSQNLVVSFSHTTSQKKKQKT